MRVAIDLDGTAWKHRTFFAELMRALQGRGHQVGILTAHKDNIKDADLKLFAARGFPAPDFFLNAESITIHHVRDWKLAQMKEHAIDVLFDDFDGNHIELVVNG